MGKNQPDIICKSCGYGANSGCLMPCGYCTPAICNKCKSIYDVNTEFVGETKDVNACEQCGAYDYTDWGLEKRPCPKCESRMEFTDPNIELLF